MIKDQELAKCVERIEGLLSDVEELSDPAVRDRVREIVKCLLDYHGAGLARLLQLVQQTDAAAGLPEAIVGDELVSSLLLLHGLHPADLPTRVAQALDSVRPYLESHGGNVELVEIDSGVVRLKLQGSCHGCPSSTAIVQSRIEQAILAAAPEVLEVVVDGLPAAKPVASGFVSLEQLVAS